MMAKHGLKAVWIGVFSLGFSTFAVTAAARGVSPYLPLNLAPEMERQIERVLILAGKPVMSRPIAAATVLDALPDACRRDRALCRRVNDYLRSYMRSYGITSLQPEVTITDGDAQTPIPNRHGQSVNSSWQISASGYLQWGDYVIVNAGGIVNDDDATPTGSFLSVGFDVAQLDIGFRDHWLSPFTDSGSLISTEAPTMPSITLSNYRPLTPLGISYEVFAAEMSRQEGIQYLDGTTKGHPRLAGLQLGIEPVTGYALSFNRIAQYGGGARSNSALSDFTDALTDQENSPDESGQSLETGNRVAALASSILFPGKLPLAVRAEYAGEDNAYAGNRLLGATNFSLGIDFPRLSRNLDLTFEASEWQNTWYVHHLYPEGLTNEGRVIGHWFGNERAFGDAIGGDSQMVRVGWYSPAGNYWQATYRTMQLDPDWRGGPTNIDYDRVQSLSVNLNTQVRNWPVSAELMLGEDVFGDSFARLSASIDLSGIRRGGSGAGAIDEEEVGDADVDFFVDVGVVQAEVTKILAVDIPDFTTDAEQDAHLAFGVRRPVASRSDIGVRLEWERVDDHQLFSFRAVDYRFRWGRKIALNGFFGVGRYDVDLPAYGYYWGAGLQYRDIIPKWDLSLDWREHYKMGRDKTALAGDPPSTPDRTRMFFDVNSYALYLSYRF